ncbi:MAG: type II toxin-antitoxin system RelE/ParE family toxin [Pseudomonadota bacterium]|nr:type II toxin-antitoxin system RelE/ParE family toxin [Burkholderiales bacterium]MDQ3197142.1 type II toxin-antitoxin system RelE/ParE family toxin [Pseudomonadota bacterium]
MRLRWTKRAERDLDEIAAYIGIDSPPAAARVILELIEQTEALSIQPAIGRPGRVAGTREFIMAGLPYILPYRVRGSDVEILRVLHTSRRWPEDI